MKQVDADSQGKVKMGPGTLYGSMSRMMEAGLIRESDKRVDSIEARHWAAHFQELEGDLLDLEVKLLGNVSKQHVRTWINEGRFLTGKQVAAAGLAELIELK